MEFSFAGHTDVGRVRARNEDALLQRPERRLFAVADGMGGHAAGDIASRIAVDVLDEHTAHPSDDPGAQLQEAARSAHQAILRAAAADSALQGMGTTLTALRLLDDGTALIAHIGDSRAYVWRNGTLDQLTRDHTWVQDQVEAGLLSEAQARRHPFSAMLTCALGVDDVELQVQLLRRPCAVGDTFLLCSDGLIASLGEADIRRILADREDLDGAARALVEEANSAGGPDNITVALVRIQSIE